MQQRIKEQVFASSTKIHESLRGS